MATTYLQLVNDVLTRLREANVSTVSQNTYSALVGKLVNDAKREVEDAWNWETLRSTYSFNTTASTVSYALAGSGDKFRVLAAYNDTNDNFLEQRPSKFFTENILLSPSAVEGIPAYYGVNGIDTNGDGLVDIYPVPDGVYTIRFDLAVPEAELSSDSDLTRLNKTAIVSLAWAKAIEERGEDGGVGVSSQYAVAKQALADAIAIEAGRKADEVNWYWV